MERASYDFGSTPPPGESNLVLGTRQRPPNNAITYEVYRTHAADGTDKYRAHLGLVDSPTTTATTATHGTLRLTRAGFKVTAIADGETVQTLIAQNGARLLVTLAATLGSCESGSSCSYTPRWHQLRLNSGRLVNQP